MFSAWLSQVTIARLCQAVAISHQALEHSRRVQVHYRRRHAHRLGQLRWVLTLSKDATHCVRRLGQAREGVELEQLQASHKSRRAHRRRLLDQHFTRWLFVRLRWQDGTAMLWDVNDGKHLYSLDAGGTINALTFSPKNYWLVAATDGSIKVWDLENKNVLEELSCKDPPKSGIPWCVSLTWSADGNVLFAGSTDGSIYVYEIGTA